jgi:glycosyltransferase involved in cell wall biosynthesis
MSKLKVLHIVPWFPNSNNKIEGIFIAEHIKQLNNHCLNDVLHINFGRKKEKVKDECDGVSIDRITLKPILDKWIFKERLASKEIIKYLKKNQSSYDIVNFYITYPNAIGISKLKIKFPNIKFCMMEQWSAFHTEFRLPKGNKGRLRIESIFNNKIPLFVVSNALGQDILNFISDSKRAYKVIPNCVNGELFFHREKNTSKDFIFASINNWSEMKNPIVLIKAFKKVVDKYENVKLVLAGDGVLISEMKALINELDLGNKVDLKGRILKSQVIDELNNANIYCQSSNYETFSAICIESLATGTPVLATKIGGMKDFINKDNGELIEGMNVDSWFLAMEKNYLEYSRFNGLEISRNCLNLYNTHIVGELFFNALLKVYNEK